MGELETRKLLKIFGVTVTDLENESQQIVRKARELDSSTGPEASKKFAELAQDALELIADMNAKWMEVTNYLYTQQRKIYDELIQVSRKILPSSNT